MGKGGNAGYQHFLLFPQCFQKASFSRLLKIGIVLHLQEAIKLLNPLPDMPLLGSSSSTANKDKMLKIWTNGDTII